MSLPPSGTHLAFTSSVFPYSMRRVSFRHSFLHICFFKASSAADGGSDAFNIIMWMDHRAVAETEAINATGHSVLTFVGGKMSPEMQVGRVTGESGMGA